MEAQEQAQAALFFPLTLKLFLTLKLALTICEVHSNEAQSELSVFWRKLGLRLCAENRRLMIVIDLMILSTRANKSTSTE